MSLSSFGSTNRKLAFKVVIREMIPARANLLYSYTTDGIARITEQLAPDPLK
jgi:hypothetical protein